MRKPLQRTATVWPRMWKQFKAVLTRKLNTGVNSLRVARLYSPVADRDSPMSLSRRARTLALALGLSAFGLSAVAEDPQPPATATQDYTLGTGDQLRVIVFGENDLSGQFSVDDTGHVRLPLIGQVEAAGRTVHQFEGDVSAKLSQGYLKSPRVSVEVTNYRPFFIIGEVNKPG